MHELFKKRRSVRQFLDKPVEKEKIHQILCAAHVAPSANGMKGWEFIVVNDKDTMMELSKSGQFQMFLKDVPSGIVIVAPESKNWLENCAIVAEHIALEAVNQGLSSCWANIRIGKTLEDKDREEYVRNILSIPNEYRVLCVMAIGYAMLGVKEHSETEYNDEIVHDGEW